MTGEKFLSGCRLSGLTLSMDYNNGTISITGRPDLAAQAREELDKSPELQASVLAVLAKTDKADRAAESNTKFHIFEVENKHGERFLYSISCIDEVLQSSLAGLRVIREIEPHIWVIDSNTGIGSYQPVLIEHGGQA